MPSPTADPFQESSDYRKIMREAKIGILLLLMLVGFFVYVVYYRVEQFKSQLPQYVLDAPVANLVEPDQYFHQLRSQVAAAEQPAPTTKLQTASRAIPPVTEKLEKRTEIQPPQKNELLASQPKTTPPPEKKRLQNLSSFLPAFSFGKSKKERSKNEQVSKAPVEYPVVVASANTPIALPTVTEPHRIERVKQAPDLRNPKKELLPQLKPLPPETQPEPPATAKHSLAIPKLDQFTKELASVEVAEAQPITTSTEFESNGFSPSEIHNMSPTTDVPDNTTSEPNNDFAASFDTAGPDRLNSKSSLFEPTQVETKPPHVEPANDFEVVVVDPIKPAAGKKYIDPKIETTLQEPLTAEPPKTDPMQSYVVKDGDSYWAIAQNVYGDGRYFRALFQHNQSQQVSFENLAPGTELFTPSVDILLVRYPDLCPPDKVAASSQKGIGAADLADLPSQSQSPSPSVYETVSGETLFEIARRQLGQASRYLEILELNRENLPQKVTHLTKLGSGIQLQMPR